MWNWQLGWVLRYQSGALIQTPYSSNQLNPELSRTTQTNWSYVPGVSPMAVDPNCACFNPQTTLVLTPRPGRNHPQDQMMLPCRPTCRQVLREEARQGDRARGISTECFEIPLAGGGA